MRGAQFTALMLHQCAAVVAVNLQIDQTAEPKGSKALSRRVKAQQSRRLTVGVSDGTGYLAPTWIPTQIHTAHTHACIISVF